MAWLELSIAMLADAADSGSAGTVLFGFGCTERVGPVELCRSWLL